MKHYIVAIACVDKDFGIGHKNRLLFNIKEDKNFFKNVTSSNCVVMGGNTFRSLGGRPLPGRENLVLTSNPNPIKWSHNLISFKQIDFYKHFETLLDAVLRVRLKKSNVYIIGGGSIYEQFLQYCDCILLTWVNSYARREADAYFPKETMMNFDFRQSFNVFKGKVYDRVWLSKVKINIDLLAKSGIEVDETYKNALKAAYDYA